MGYPQEIMVGAITRNSNAHDTAEVLTAAAAAYGAYTIHAPLAVTGLTFRVTTATSDLTDSVVRLETVEPIGDVTTAIGLNMTIPTGVAAGKLYRKDFSAAYVPAGYLLQLKHQTQGALGGTPAGAGFYGFLAHFEPENRTNQTNYVVA